MFIKEKLLKISLLLTALSSSPLFATRWSGGGGELVKDSQNPWWVQNTTEVTYCIKHDADHFQLSSESLPLDMMVRNALDFWQKDFKNVNVRGLDAQIATQNFRQVACHNDVDLIFQFGTLTSEQLKEMAQQGLYPRDYVSLAVRTDYDRVNLRAKGFIYLAPDSGPLKPDAEEMISRPWARGNGGLINATLRHELGHVFGIPHSSRFSDLMAADYVETMVTNEASAEATAYYQGGSEYFDSYLYYQAAGGAMVAYSPEAKEFFGFPADDGLASAKLVGKTVQILWQASNQSAEPHVVGEIELDYETVFAINPLFIIKLWLPREQTVLTPATKGSRMALGPSFAKKLMGGIYQSKDGRIRRNVDVTMDAVEKTRIKGVLNDRVFEQTLL